MYQVHSIFRRQVSYFGKKGKFGFSKLIISQEKNITIESTTMEENKGRKLFKGQKVESQHQGTGGISSVGQRNSSHARNREALSFVTDCNIAWFLTDHVRIYIIINGSSL